MACGVCFTTGWKSVKGGEAHHRGNPPAGPTLVLGDLMNIVRLRRVKPNLEGCVRSQERMCRASRVGVRPEMPTLGGSVPGFQGKRGGS